MGQPGRVRTTRDRILDAVGVAWVAGAIWALVGLWPSNPDESPWPAILVAVACLLGATVVIAAPR